MELVGTVEQCWRYPVKSMQGLLEPALDVGPQGVSGDRHHALLDEASGILLSAKRIKELLLASADDEAIHLPDGRRVALDDPDADGVLSSWLARRVRLAAPVPEQQLSYEMTFDPPNDDAELVSIPAPPGTFLDYAAIHLLTSATLEGCAARRPELSWEVRRFRPNLYLRVDGPPFVEDEWVGRALRVGTDLVLETALPTVRCAMPLRAQPGLDREPALFRAMNELHEAFPNHLGAYVDVRSPGRVAVGDPVVLLSD